VSEFAGRINEIYIIDKPVIHLTTDRIMAVDIDVKIHHGRPWFAYPMPDDFSVYAHSVQMSISTSQPSSLLAFVNPVPTFLAPLDNASLAKLNDVREGYPWITPSHRNTGPIISSMGETNEIQSIGCRWQSLIVSPQRLAWMHPPEVGSEAKFQWWTM